MLKNILWIGWALIRMIIFALVVAGIRVIISGVFNKLPSYYQDYERERRKYQEKFKREQEEKQREKFRKFFHGFFGFDESPDEPEKKDNDYPYSVFGLTKSASDEDVKKAYRKSILKAHPDKGGSNELFRKVREAWDYFSSFSSRAAST